MSTRIRDNVDTKYSSDHVDIIEQRRELEWWWEKRKKWWKKEQDIYICDKDTVYHLIIYDKKGIVHKLYP